MEYQTVYSLSMDNDLPESEITRAMQALTITNTRQVDVGNDSDGQTMYSTVLTDDDIRRIVVFLTPKPDAGGADGADEIAAPPQK